VETLTLAGYFLGDDLSGVFPSRLWP